MFKEIPYYGKDNTVKKIEKINNNMYNVTYFIENGKKTIECKSKMTEEKAYELYLFQLIGYIEGLEEKYNVAKKMIANNSIEKKCTKIKNAAIIIFLASIGCYLTILLGLINSMILLGSVAVGIVVSSMMQAYALGELKNKITENEIKKSIAKYEELVKEVALVKKKLNEKNIDITQFSKIKPIQNPIEHDKVKSRTKKI